MKKGRRHPSIGTKMYIFVIITVLFAAFGVCMLSFFINASQIDSYFKRLTINSAQYASTYVDIDFIKQLRSVVESDEYQAIRGAAEAADDDTSVVDYLKQKGLWDKYVAEREELINFVKNMTDVEYLYIVAWGVDSDHDMYLLDADDVAFYETGYYEEREAEFEGVEPHNIIEPVISNGDWGWLCSGYVPVYDEEGNLVCHVGCDVDMENVMSARWSNLTYILSGALALMAIVLAGAIFSVRRQVVKPLNQINSGMKGFTPGAGKDYKESGIIDLDITRKDEIGDIYNGIRSMQTRIVDYINDITAIRQDKEKAEEEIGEISREAYKDSLTGVGNKSAYNRKVSEIDYELGDTLNEVAIVMMDVNLLKTVNDNYGHAAGDSYLCGCCHSICDIFKHSPVYRVGGDEFVAILLGEDYKNREERLSELRSAFDRTFHDMDVEPWLRYSVSAGMAEYSYQDENIESVFRRADKLMYEDKMSFKNKNGLNGNSGR